MKISIHYKITAIFVLVTAAILSGVYIYLNIHLKEAAFRYIREGLIKEARLSKSMLDDYSPDPENPYSADLLADRIGKSLGARATIIGLDGTVFGESELGGAELKAMQNHLDRPEVDDAITKGIGESRRFSTTLKKNIYYVAVVFGKDKPSGIIRLAMPVSEINIASGYIDKLLIALFLAAFILAVVISLIASSVITKPLKEISWVAQNIARGDFSKRVYIETRDEIGALSRAINYMSEQLKARIDDIVANRSRLEAVLLSMFEGVMVVDAGGRILLMNNTLRELFGLTEDPAGRRPIEAIRSLEIQDICDSALSLKNGVESREVSVITPNEKILSVHATPVIHDKKAEGAVLVFYDITELRRLENIRKDFVANVSHELRTPISNIKGYAETLIDGAIEDRENARDFVNIIHHDADRLAKLIDDLLELARIESGRMPLQLKAQPVALLIERMVNAMHKQADARSVMLSADIPKGLPDVMIDENRIAQVLLNLIDNAIKYTQPDGRVTLRAFDKGGYIEVSVIDTGAGIPENDIPRIFERFYTVDKARSRELGGTGLGLSIVKHIVQAHKGDVHVQSIVGAGSTFSFTLPKA